MSSIVLRNGRLIDPANGIDHIGDLAFLDGLIVPHSGPTSATVIDCAGCWVVPGLVDPHVHLRDPGFPHKETILSGLRAAAAGGFTTVAAMANTAPVNDCPEITRYMLAHAQDARAADLVPVSAVTRNLDGRELTGFAAMAAAGARMFSDDGIPIDDPGLLCSALRAAAALNLPISLHEEDRALTAGGAMNQGPNAERLGVAGIPAAAESARVERDLELARRVDAPVHIAHVSTARSLDLIRAARRGGANVTCEAAPHHFTLDDTAVLDHGPDARMAPPLRSAGDRAALRAALADGTIDMIASDHAPHDPGSKRMDTLAHFFPHRGPNPLPTDAAQALASAANGIVGLESALGLTLQLVHQNVIDPARMVKLMSLNPARLLRLDRGALTPGKRADVTVIDPNLCWTVAPDSFCSLSRNTPFAGLELRGRAVLTIVNGAIVHDARPAERL